MLLDITVIVPRLNEFGYVLNSHKRNFILLPYYSQVMAYHLFVFNYSIKCALDLKSSYKILNILSVTTT